MIEIETRAKVKDFDPIKRKIKEFGGKFIKKEKQVDKIFGREKDLDKEHKIIEGCFSARVRKKGDKISVELKEICRDGVGSEFSSPISNVNEGVIFLTKLDFDEAFTISKIREVYELDDFEISLDEVDKLGNYIEIEYRQKADVEKEKALAKCIELLEKLDHSAKIETKKYGDLMQDLINKSKK